jgi:phospholipid-binding lipoprotein MlaA
MRTLRIYALWFSFSLALAPGAPAQTSSTNAAPAAASQENSNSFKDPFAEENKTAKPAEKVSDPLEPLNRFFFKVNDKFYFWLLKPAAQGYGKVVPQPARSGINNFYKNVKFPVRFANNLLEGRFKAVGIETSRFLLNSTVGLGGLMDPARQELHFEAQPADFDQTLGVYGIGHGPYLCWPVVGPCSVRGTVGLAGDTMLSPWTYSDSWTVSFGVPAFDVLNGASLRIGDYEMLKKGALDPYVSFRSAYFENRRGLINP